MADGSRDPVADGPGDAVAAGLRDPAADGQGAVASRERAPEQRAVGRTPGLREALLVGELVVAAVLVAGALTYVLPADLRDVVLRGPLLILVLLVGTAAVLWRISRPGAAGR